MMIGNLSGIFVPFSLLGHHDWPPGVTVAVGPFFVEGMNKGRLVSTSMIHPDQAAPPLPAASKQMIINPPR